ncbi:MAG: wax ester/triacylglycerol synthase family O-acyltransferase [Myxococcales bacterium]|nr:MAG: wax ester/triacylglycerol synthase family O-acyltransferase [Myxococcales bacterium]
MARYAYERLSPQDNDFLLWERHGLPMHTAGTQIFRAGPLARPDGGIDFAEIRSATERVLHRVPRYRQKLRWIPGSQQAVWVDDPHFNLDFHVRHTALPRPGNEEQLRRLSARIMEQPLDLSRPLWETWVVEGLEGGRFATINKLHHCMLDGAAGIVLSQIMMSRRPVAAPELGEVPRWMPRPEPTDAELRRHERLHGLLAPLRSAARFGSFLRESADRMGEVGSRLRALQGMALWKLRPASETPLNGPVGPHRIFAWTTLPLEDLKEMRRAAGCKLNDVVLAIAAGAVRDFMKRRGVRPEKLDFRVSTPVDVRQQEERSGISGNRVSAWLLRLPLGEADPLARLSAIRRETQALKDSRQAEAVELVNAIHEWLPIDVQGFARGTMNTIVTNVPGPAFPLYLCGAELLAIYPQAPLLEGIGLVTGVISYNGRLCWGFNADYDRVPDLDAYVAGVNRSFLELAEALGVRSSGPIAAIGEAQSPPERDESAAPGGRRRSSGRGVRRDPPVATH